MIITAMHTKLGELKWTLYFHAIFFELTHELQWTIIWSVILHQIVANSHTTTYTQVKTYPHVPSLHTQQLGHLFLLLFFVHHLYLHRYLVLKIWILVAFTLLILYLATERLSLASLGPSNIFVVAIMERACIVKHSCLVKGLSSPTTFFECALRTFSI